MIWKILSVNLEDEDMVILLLCGLPRSYKNFKDINLYGKEDTFTLEEVQAVLKTKELIKSKDLRDDDSCECLNV